MNDQQYLMPGVSYSAQSAWRSAWDFARQLHLSFAIYWGRGEWRISRAYEDSLFDDRPVTPAELEAWRAVGDLDRAQSMLKANLAQVQVTAKSLNDELLTLREENRVLHAWKVEHEEIVRSYQDQSIRIADMAVGLITIQETVQRLLNGLDGSPEDRGASTDDDDDDD